MSLESFTPKDVFLGINRTTKENGFPLESSHVDYFDSLAEGTEVSFKNPDGELSEGYIVKSKDKENLKVTVVKKMGDQEFGTTINIEDIRS